MSVLSVLNPANETPVTKIELFDLEATDAALARATEAATKWRDVTPSNRAHLLRRFAQVVDEHNEELAQLEVANSGHTISNARWEAENVRNVLAYYSGAPERHSGKQIPVAGGVDLTLIAVTVAAIVAAYGFLIPRLLAVRRLPFADPTTQLIGKTATVTEALQPEGMVSLSGTLWLASASQGTLEVGRQVRIVQVEGLRLTVR